MFVTFIVLSFVVLSLTPNPAEDKYILDFWDVKPITLEGVEKELRNWQTAPLLGSIVAFQDGGADSTTNSSLPKGLSKKNRQTRNRMRFYVS